MGFEAVGRQLNLADIVKCLHLKILYNEYWCFRENDFCFCFFNDTEITSA